MMTIISPKQTFKQDTAGVLISEAAQTFKDREGVGFLGENIKAIFTNPALFETYVDSLSEGMEADLAIAFTTLMENYRQNVINETALTTITNIAALQGPMLRKFLPKICIKDTLPTEVTTIPTFWITHLVPYMIDLDGNRHELPQSMRQKFADDGTVPFGLKPLYRDWIPMSAAKNLNLFTTTTYGSGAAHKKDGIDRKFSITQVTMNLGNGTSGTNVEVNTDIYRDLNNNFYGVVTYTNPVAIAADADNGITAVDANTTFTDTIMGHIDLRTGDLMVTNINGTAANENAAVTKIKITGYISSEMNNYAESIQFDIKKREIVVGTGGHVTIPLPIEYIQDLLATFNIDGALKLVDLGSTVFAQKTDLEAWRFLKESFIKNNLGSIGFSGGAGYYREFDVYPAKEFTGRPKDWREELKTVIEHLIVSIRNDSCYPGGKFVLLGSPIDMMILNNVNWVFNGMTGDERSGVSVDYSIGTYQTSAGIIDVVQTENIPQGELKVFFYPSMPDQYTYKYYPYSFHVENNTGYRDPNNPNVPAIMMTKRHTFAEFTPLQGVIRILNNTGQIRPHYTYVDGSDTYADLNKLNS